MSPGPGPIPQGHFGRKQPLITSQKSPSVFKVMDVCLFACFGGGVFVLRDQWNSNPQ